MRLTLVKLVPRNVLHARIFDDVILAFYFALKRLGHGVDFANNRLNPAGRNLIFGANARPEEDWLRQRGPDRVIVNLEQFRLRGDKWANWAENEPYLNLLREYPVWDYSPGNTDFLKTRGIDVSFFSLGYVPEMTRLAANPREKAEALFYGGINERRFAVIDAVTRAGVRVRCLEDEYGQPRDQAIFESALALNIHRGGAANLEMARLAYLLANRKAVVSERNADTEVYEGLEEACAFYPYERLAAGTVELMADEKARQRQAERGFELFRQISLTDSLERLAGRGPGYAAAAPFATRHNRELYGGPVPEWLSPVDDLERPEPPDARLKSARARRFLLLRLRLKRLRYWFILKTAKGLRRFNYQRKLENLNQEIDRWREIQRA